MIVGKKSEVPCTMTCRANADQSGGKENCEKRAHVDEAIGKRARPGERVRDSLADRLPARTLVGLAEVLDLETTDCELALRLAEPASLARGSRQGKEGDNTNAGGQDTLEDKDLERRMD